MEPDAEFEVRCAQCKRILKVVYAEIGMMSYREYFLEVVPCEWCARKAYDDGYEDAMTEMDDVRSG